MTDAVKRVTCLVVIVSISVFFIIFFGTTALSSFTDNTHNRIVQPQHYDSNNSSVYVCITGQLSRLELHNKIHKLFLPLHQRGYKVYIGLALTSADDTAFYTHNDNGDKMQLYTNMTQVKQILLNVSGVSGVRHFEKINSMGSIPFNENFLKSLMNKTGINNTNYVTNTARQLRALQYCYQGTNMATDAALFVRMRDDTIIHDINFNSVLKQAQDGALVTTACDAWRGINDKMAFGPRSLAMDFFMRPFECYVSMDKVFVKLNTEILEHQCYLKHGLKMVTTDDYLVTKKSLTIVEKKKEHDDGDGDTICMVKGLPFQNDSRYCPKTNMSNIAPSYTVKCHSIHSHKTSIAL